MKKRVAILGKTNLRAAQIEDLGERCALTVYDDNVPIGSEEAVIERAEGADLILINAFTPITRHVVAELSTVKTIVSCSSGIDHVDLEACGKSNIPVRWFPGYCARTVAEKTLSMILLGLNRTVEALRSSEEGRWDYLSFQGREIPGRLVAVLGLGSTGRIVRDLCLAVGFDVEASNSKTPDDEVASLLARADVVTLHMALTDRTRYFLDGPRLAHMRSDVCIVNTARGTLINEEALVAFLRENPVATALVDVLEREPPETDRPLRQLSNAAVTPHVGWNSAESDLYLAEQTHLALVTAIDSGWATPEGETATRLLAEEWPKPDRSVDS
jgi:phosphoglycerate dehydrogenase-like enzyme